MNIQIKMGDIMPKITQDEINYFLTQNIDSISSDCETILKSEFYMKIINELISKHSQSITLELLKHTSHSFREFIENEKLTGLLKKGKITLEQAMDITTYQLNCLSFDNAYNLIDSDTVTFDDIFNLSTAKNVILITTNLAQKIINGSFLWDDYVDISETTIQLLMDHKMVGLINKSIISPDNLKFVTQSVKSRLLNPVVSYLINNPEIDLTGDDIILAPAPMAAALERLTVAEMIMNNSISKQQLYTINWNGYTAITRTHIAMMYQSEVITFSDINQLNTIGIYALENVRIKDLYTSGLINFELLNTIEDDILDQITETMTDESIIELVTNQSSSVQANPEESTMSSSIHGSASQSASILKENYDKTIDITDYATTRVIPLISETADQNIDFVNSTAEQQASETTKRAAALRCLDRLLNENDYTDHRSGISLIMLVCLQHMAIDDASRRISTKIDAQQSLLDGLYQIQRGGNINSAKKDNGLDDNPICSPGTFNKLIEIMVGLHPDSRLIIITPELATLKLQAIVKEETAHIVFKNYQNLNLIGELQEHECAEPIYQQISESVARRIADEFSILFQSPEYTSIYDNPKFKEFIGNGRYTEAEEKTISASITKGILISGKGIYGTPDRNNKSGPEKIMRRRLKQREPTSKSSIFIGAFPVPTDTIDNGEIGIDPNKPSHGKK